MSARLCAVLVVGACLAVLAWQALAKPRPASFPSRLEKSCFARTIYVPCHIKDEALSQQWSI